MKKHLFLISLFVISTTMYSQIAEEDNYFPVVPNSPNVSSLSKYEEVAVSKNTGLPNISVPIHSISLDGITIPVYLNYHAGGIRVNEVAPWTGQSWNLIAGGSITRTVRHLADDSPHGYIFTQITTEMIYDACVGCSYPCTDDYDCVEYTNTRIMNNTLDFEADIFSYNAPGISGKFMFNQIRDVVATGEIKSFPMSHNKIIPTFGSTNKITSWKIIDELGNAYFFEVGDILENTDTHTIESAGNLPQDNPMEPYTPSYTQTWNLKRIETHKGNKIHFQYAQFQNGYHECSFSGQSKIIEVGQPNNLKTTYIETEGTTRYLSKIYGDFGSIDISIDSNPREDYPDGNALKDIIIKNSANEQVKKYVFNYFYSYADEYINGAIYGCGGAINGAILYDPSNPNSYIPYKKRMFLEEVEVLGENNALDYTYSFDYDNEDLLPHRNSYAQDFWGFYNGKTSNSTLLLDISNPYANTPNRQVDETYGKLGLLKRMYHPEGGYTDFEYESNKAVVQNGTTLGYRIVPSEEKTLEFNSTFDTYETDYDGGYTIYKFKKALILNKKTFRLQTDNRQFRYRIEQSTSNGQSICLTEGGLPIEGDCSLWVSINKTNLNPELHTDPSQINLGSVSYDPNFTGIETPLNDEYINEKVGTGVYVVEFYIKTKETEPQVQGLDMFDIENDVAIFKLSYRAAKDNVKFYGNHNNNYTHVEIPIGGQRIKNIKTYSDTDVLAKSRHYRYVLDGSSKSSGRVLKIPYFVGVGQSGVFENSLTTMPLLTTSSNNVSYTRVEEDIMDIENSFQKIAQVNTFSFHELPQQNINPMFPFMEDWRYGQSLVSEAPLKSKETKNYDDNFVSITSNPDTYYYGTLCPTTSFPYQLTSLNGVYGYILPEVSNTWYSDKAFFKLQYGRPTLNSETSQLFFDDNPNKVVTTTKSYEYENPSHFKPTTITTNTSDSNKTIVTKIKYPDDLSSELYMDDLIDENRIANPIQTETYSNTTLLSTKKTSYYNYNGTIILPRFIQTSKGEDNLELRFQYDRYDDYGNPVQVRNKDDKPISYIWGYKGQYPVAKIEGFTYGAITPSLITAIHTASDSGNEANTLTALQDLRDELADDEVMVTTYTYKPLIGMTSLTDPKGDTMTYHYDVFGRLQYIKDADDNIIEEYNYHYKN